MAPRVWGLGFGTFSTLGLAGFWGLVFRAYSVLNLTGFTGDSVFRALLVLLLLLQLWLRLAVPYTFTNQGMRVRTLCVCRLSLAQTFLGAERLARQASSAWDSKQESF